MNATSQPPTLPPKVESDLVRVLGRDAVLVDPDRLLVYESDGLTRYRGRPSAVLLPRDTEGCAAALALLHDAGLAVVPRGAGTGLSGGAVPTPASVVVGTARMNRILALDPGARRARVQAGVVNTDLGRAARATGLWYAPDPSSQTACTLGGNVAENSGGPHCLKYGVTSRYVTALTVVGSGGEVYSLDRSSAPLGALDLVGVFVGSEGCFGIATEIEITLGPVPSEARTLLAAFEHTHEAGEAVTAILERGLLPAALEIVDGATIRAVEASIYAAGYPLDAGAALVVEFDGAGPGLDDELDEAAALCRDHGARDVRLADSAVGRAQLWAGRKKAFGAMGRLAPDLMVQDATVPRSRLASVLRQVDEIAERHGLLVANVFHAGDGNLHPNLLFDRRDAEQVERVERASSEIMRVCVEAGGTITGEHGVGLDKRGYMRFVHGEDELQAMAGVRAAFDPVGRFNPGKVLPDAPGAAVDLGPPEPRRAASDRSPADVLGQHGLEIAPRSGRLVGVRPRDTDELARLVGLAATHGFGLSAPGSGDRGADARPSVAVDLHHFTGLDLHDAADFTVTAGAGERIDALQRTLAARGQWLAVDGPDLGGRRVGEVVATGDALVLARACGAVRDQVLGLTMIDGSGRVLELGGRVMKNVAGFDLTRLACGSRGRLGVVTRVTFRTWPLPRSERFGSIEVDDARRLVEVVAALLQTRVVPLSLEAGTVRGEGAGRFEVLVRLAGSAGEVDHAAAELDRASPASVRWLVAGDGLERQRALRGLTADLTRRPPRVSVPTADGLAAALADATRDGGTRSWALPDQGLVWSDAASDDREAPARASSPELERRIVGVFDPDGVFGRVSGPGVS